MIEKHNGRSFDLELLRAGDVVFDVGCRGFDLWQMLGHNCRVENFDADPTTEVPEGAEMFFVAIVGSQRAQKLVVQLAMHKDPQARTIIGGYRESKTVPCMSLQKAMVACDVEQLGLLKLNCEGSEYEIMQDVARLGPIARQIAVSYHDFCELNPQSDMEAWYLTLHDRLKAWYEITRHVREIPPWGGEPHYIDSVLTLKREYWR